MDFYTNLDKAMRFDPGHRGLLENAPINPIDKLDSTLKREQSALKAFLTSKTDTYRQPYARVQTKKPRRTSFCATVNPQEFLNDETGSRRYWVVKPKQIDVERLKALSQRIFQESVRQGTDRG